MLAVDLNSANDAVLAEGKRVMIIHIAGSLLEAGRLKPLPHPG